MPIWSYFDNFSVQINHNNNDIAEKKKLIAIRRYALMDRELEEVRYVVDFTNRFLNLVDKK